MNDRKREVVNACLNCFISKGFFATTTRDLSEAIKLQSGGIYYYFKTKDDIVAACAEAAMFRLELNLITPAMADIDDLDGMMSNLQMRAIEMAPTMQFLASICTTEKYRPTLQPVLDRLWRRCESYVERFAKKMDCSVELIEPYVYMCITSVSNYMIFGEDSYIEPQMKLIVSELKRVKNKGERI